jgi:hypothetical protein
MTAFIAAGATLVAVQLTNHQSLQVQRQQFDETRRNQRQEFRENRLAVLRVRRAKVYANFLAAADRYASELSGAKLTLPQACRRSAQRCGVELSRLVRAQLNFKSAVNDLYVYGSALAYKAQRRVSGTLPSSLGQPTLLLPTVDGDRFKLAYRAFLAVMRKELGPPG